MWDLGTSFAYPDKEICQVIQQSAKRHRTAFYGIIQQQTAALKVAGSSVFTNTKLVIQLMRSALMNMHRLVYVYVQGRFLRNVIKCCTVRKSIQNRWAFCGSEIVNVMRARKYAISWIYTILKFGAFVVNSFFLVSLSACVF